MCGAARRPDLRAGPMSQQSILIIEDDQALAAMIADFLAQQGYLVATDARGDRAVARILAERPSLVVLDLMLPGRDGLSVCREVRDGYPGPILMLTARGAEVDEVVGLEIGADDYLAKPVRPRVLLARIRALLRRPSGAPSARRESLTIGALTVDASTREARMRGVAVPLTSGEFDLLFYLASHAGQVMSRAVLYQELRGVHPDDFDRSIDLMVSRLRHKLQETASQGEIIKTVRGVGYLYVTK
ncbi:Transcriptional regulatory protein RstA [Minicystis rosea]|nr:Transcriptional regulatory protein RstA [Minicystis rosea]